jgi:DNA repair protein RadC
MSRLAHAVLSSTAMKTDAELLCVAARLRNPSAIADRLETIGGLDALVVAGAELLALPSKEVERVDALLALAARLHAPADLPDRIERAEDVVAYFTPRVGLNTQESFWVVLLDARGRPLGHHEVARGTLTACLVHPREVFAPALRRRAASIIVVHNHPSGDAEPSAEDRTLTDRLAACGALLGVPLLDHIVVARSGFTSLGGGLDTVEEGAA